MPRKPRIHFPGAFSHVIACGNRREKIFRNEKDYQLYLNFLSDYKDVPVHRFNDSRFKGSVGLDLSLFADIPRIRRRIGRHEPNTQKLFKRIFAYFRNRLYHRCHTMFADAEPARHLAGGADNNLQPCKETTWNVELFNREQLHKDVYGFSLYAYTLMPNHVLC